MSVNTQLLHYASAAENNEAWIPMASTILSGGPSVLFNCWEVTREDESHPSGER
jgi:hypothetical protein